MGNRRTQWVGGHKSHSGRKGPETGGGYRIKRRRPRRNPKAPGTGRARRRGLSRNDKLKRRYENRRKALERRRAEKAVRVKMHERPWPATRYG